MSAPQIRPAPKIRNGGGIRSRMRELPSSQRAAFVALVFAGVGLVTLWMAPRGDIAAISVVRLVAGVVLFGVVGLLVALAILRPLHQRPISSAVAWTIALAALLVPLVFVLLPAAHSERALHPESFIDEGGSIWMHAGRCLLFGTLIALPVVMSIVLVDRREHLGRNRALQAALVGGAAGNLALLLHCPLVSPAHFGLGHAMIPVVLGLAAFALTIRSRASS